MKELIRFFFISVCGVVIDIAIAYALLNFIASLAAARLFQRHRQIDVSSEEEDGVC